MSHHSEGPDEEMDRVKGLLSELQGKERFGATGQFPDGKLTAADEGEIRFGITVYKGKLVIHFGKPVKWMAMNAEQALELGKELLLRSDEIK